ncbi:AAA family ATPase [Myceligenerans salitolerans]|uniref:MinD-like ATPase involved in chromosome partitioning or flagellar assembly n=1 Tax=Myceligenerans salitolerans TaxID=1230528 RepID=A0ABS3I759_9MICO|nr:hypothetical protein [Myceligenerans salitolerans]MBO0608835.1 hypothetical protein [Myceligenerans salitolerans]
MTGPSVVPVLCAVLGPAEADVVRSLGTSGTGTTVTRRCADLPELLASAEAGSGRAAVVSATLPGLGRDAVARMHEAGVRVIALDEAPEPSTDRLAAIGVDGVARSVEDLVSVVRDETALSPAAARGKAASSAGAGKGRIVAVWGPVGAPGRTTTAIELAVALAAGPPVTARPGGVGRSALPGRRGLFGRAGRRGPGRGDGLRTPRGGAREQVVLADADTYGPCVAPRLGMLDDSSGLAGAVRAVGTGPLDVETLARHAPVALPGVRVLGGIGRPGRWAELSGAGLDAVWECLRDLADWTVIDTGPILETDEVLSYDTRAPQRNAATLGALAAADVVVVVGSGDPIGLQRLVRGLDDLAAVPHPVTPDRLVVVNRLRAAAVGANPRSSVRSALTRFAGVDAHLVPDDPAGLDAGLLSGRALFECAPGSPARAAFGHLAEQVRQLVHVRTTPHADRSPWVGVTGSSRA